MDSGDADFQHNDLAQFFEKEFSPEELASFIIRGESSREWLQDTEISQRKIDQVSAALQKQGYEFDADGFVEKIAT